MHFHQDRETLTIDEAATALGISRKHAYDLAATDRLSVPVLRLGRRLVVSRRALERVLQGELSPRPGPDDEAA